MTGVDLSSHEVAFLVKRFVSLSNGVFVLNVCGHVFIGIKNPSGFLIDRTERGFDKAVFVDSCESCKIGDKTDVGTFRSFNRAHSSVM